VEKLAIGLDPSYTTEASFDDFAEKKLEAIEAVITTEEDRHS
jgi:hypothetical protein